MHALFLYGFIMLDTQIAEATKKLSGLKFLYLEHLLRKRWKLTRPGVSLQYLAITEALGPYPGPHIYQDPTSC